MDKLVLTIATAEKVIGKNIEEALRLHNVTEAEVHIVLEELAAWVAAQQSKLNKVGP